MNLDKISLEKPQALQSSARTFGLNGLKPLSKAEEQLIQEKFPVGTNSRLELYLASGRGRTELPGAKGQNLDFTV